MTTTKDALRQVHGVAFDFTERDVIDTGKAFLVAISGLTKLSEKEAEAVFAAATAYGATDSAIEACRRFEYWKASAADYPVKNARLARHLVYEAIRTYRVGGAYGTRERTRTAAAARALGVPSGLVTALEGIVGAERALGDARAAVERALGGRADKPPAALEGLKQIADNEATVRDKRISLMEEDSGLQPPTASGEDQIP